MRVLHLISGGDSGGAKTHVLSLLHSLNEHIRADLVCYMEAEFSKEARELGIPTQVFDGGFNIGLKKTRELIENGNYDIVHCHGSRANLTGALLKEHFNIPFISTVHSDYKLDYLGRPMAAMTYGQLNKMALRRMDYRVCVSDQMRETLIGRGFEPNKLFPLYNGVDFSRPKPSITRSEWFNDIGCTFPEDSIVVGIAARFDAIKDVATTVRGFAGAARENEKLRLLIAGDGRERDMLKALCTELGVRDKVFFAGWINGMDGYYASVDINAISSLSETFPYAVTEAARAGIPTVASRVGGLLYAVAALVGILLGEELVDAHGLLPGVHLHPPVLKELAVALGFEGLGAVVGLVYPVLCVFYVHRVCGLGLVFGGLALLFLVLLLLLGACWRGMLLHGRDRHLLKLVHVAPRL